MMFLCSDMKKEQTEILTTYIHLFVLDCVSVCIQNVFVVDLFLRLKWEGYTTVDRFVSCKRDS